MKVILWSMAVDVDKTIVYAELYSGSVRRRRARHWDKPHPDQVILYYWDPCHKEELGKLKDSYRKPLI